MVINEFLPNPTGKDTEGEWIELFNNDLNAINLGGWQIKDASGKTFTFKNTALDSGRYLVVDYQTSKISINNSNEEIFLYNSKNELVDKAGFQGSAPSGKSLIRQGENRFVFTDEPTPGSSNVFASRKPADETPLISSKENFQQGALAAGESIELPASNLHFGNLIIGFFSALILAAVFMVVYQKINSLIDKK